MRFPLVIRRLNRNFFSQLVAAEPQTLSLFSSSKRHLSSAPPATISDEPNLPHSLRTSYGRIRAGVVQSENPSDEAAYTATLGGSQSQVSGESYAPRFVRSACFKCGKEGHWAKDCESSAVAVGENQSQVSGNSYASRVVGGACFKCGKEGHWARDCDQSSAAGVDEVQKCCPCGIGNCLVLTAKTERNRGRKFFTCPTRQENGGCGFFEWCDEPSRNAISAEDKAGKNESQHQFYMDPTHQITSDCTKSSNEYDNGTSFQNSSYGGAYPKAEAADNKGHVMKNSSTCFRCGNEGHWAKDCQAPPSSNSNTSGSVGVKGKLSSSDICYKCRQSGHWAKDCSQSIIV